jgi:hypothetical protein
MFLKSESNRPVVLLFQIQRVLLWLLSAPEL